jgi:hypothetical protein
VFSARKKKSSAEIKITKKEEAETRRQIPII